MATQSRSVNYQLGMNPSAAMQGIRTAQNQFREFSKKTRQIFQRTSTGAQQSFEQIGDAGKKQANIVTRSFKGMTKTIKSVMKNTVAHVHQEVTQKLTGAFLNGFRRIIEGGGDLQDEFAGIMTGVHKTASLTYDEAEKLGNALRQMAGEELSVSAAELAKAADVAAHLGIVATGKSVGEMTSFIKTLSKASLALPEFTGGVEQIADTIGKQLNIFKAGSDEAEQYLNVMDKLSNSFATDAQQIAEFSATFTEAARLGFSQHEVAAFGAALTAMGKQANAAGTQVQTAFLNVMTTGLDKVQELLGDSKFAEWQELFKVDKIGGLEVIMDQLSTLGEFEASQYMNKIFGKIGLKAVGSFIGDGAANMDLLKDALSKSNEEVQKFKMGMTEAYTINQEMNILANSQRFYAERIKNAWNELKIILAERIEPLITGFNKNMAPLLVAFATLLKDAAAMRATEEAMDRVGEAGTKVGKAFIHILEQIGWLQSGTNQFHHMLVSVFEVILNTVGAVEHAILSVAKGLDFVAGVIGTIKQISSETGKGLLDTIGGSEYIQLFQKQHMWVVKLAQGIQNLVRYVVGLKDTFMELGNVFRTAIGARGDIELRKFSENIQSIGRVLYDVFTTSIKIIPIVFNTIRSNIIRTSQSFSGFERVILKIVPLFIGGLTQINTFLPKILLKLEGFRDIIVDFYESLVDEGVISRLKKSTVGLVTSLGTNIENGFSNLLQYYDDNVRLQQEALENMISGIGSGMLSLIQKIGGMFGSLVMMLLSSIGSLLTGFVNMIAGLGKKLIRIFYAKIMNPVGTFFEQIQNAFARGFTEVFEGTFDPNTFKKTESSFISLQKKIVSFVVTTKDRIVELAVTIRTTLQEISASYVAYLAGRTLAKAANTIRNIVLTVQKVFDNLKKTAQSFGQAFQEEFGEMGGELLRQNLQNIRVIAISVLEFVNAVARSITDADTQSPPNLFTRAAEAGRILAKVTKTILIGLEAITYTISTIVDTSLKPFIEGIKTGFGQEGVAALQTFKSNIISSLGLIKDIIVTLLPDIQSLFDAFKTGDAKDAKDFGIIVGNAFKILAQLIAGLSRDLVKTLTFIRNFAQVVRGILDEGLIGYLSNRFTAFIQQIYTDLTQVVTKILPVKDTFMSVGDSLSHVITYVRNLATVAGGYLYTQFKRVADYILSFFRNVSEGISQTTSQITNIGAKLGGIFDAFTIPDPLAHFGEDVQIAGMTTAIEKLLANIDGEFGTSYEFVGFRKGFENLADDIQKGFSSLFPKKTFGDKFRDFMMSEVENDLSFDNLAKGFKNFEKEFNGSIGKLEKKINRFTDKIGLTGIHFVGFKQGFLNMMDDLGVDVNRQWGKSVHFVGFRQGFKNLMDDLGSIEFVGFEKGFDALMKGLKKNARPVYDVIKYIGEVIEIVTEKIRELGDVAFGHSVLPELAMWFRVLLTPIYAVIDQITILAMLIRRDLSLGEAVILSLTNAFQLITSPITLVIQTLRVVVATIQDIGITLHAVFTGQMSPVTAVLMGIQTAIVAILTPVQAVIDVFVTLINTIVHLGDVSYGHSVFPELGKWIGYVTDKVTGLMNSFSRIVNAVYRVSNAINVAFSESIMSGISPKDFEFDVSDVLDPLLDFGQLSQIEHSIASFVTKPMAALPRVLGPVFEELYTLWTLVSDAAQKTAKYIIDTFTQIDLNYLTPMQNGIRELGVAFGELYLATRPIASILGYMFGGFAIKLISTISLIVYFRKTFITAFTDPQKVFEQFYDSLLYRFQLFESAVTRIYGVFKGFTFALVPEKYIDNLTRIFTEFEIGVKLIRDNYAVAITNFAEASLRLSKSIFGWINEKTRIFDATSAIVKGIQKVINVILFIPRVIGTVLKTVIKLLATLITEIVGNLDKLQWSIGKVSEALGRLGVVFSGAKSDGEGFAKVVRYIVTTIYELPGKIAVAGEAIGEAFGAMFITGESATAAFEKFFNLFGTTGDIFNHIFNIRDIDEAIGGAENFIQSLAKVGAHLIKLRTLLFALGGEGTGMFDDLAAAGGSFRNWIDNWFGVFKIPRTFRTEIGTLRTTVKGFEVQMGRIPKFIHDIKYAFQASAKWVTNASTGINRWESALAKATGQGNKLRKVIEGGFDISTFLSASAIDDLIDVGKITDASDEMHDIVTAWSQIRRVAPETFEYNQMNKFAQYIVSVRKEMGVARGTLAGFAAVYRDFIQRLQGWSWTKPIADGIESLQKLMTRSGGMLRRMYESVGNSIRAMRADSLEKVMQNISLFIKRTSMGEKTLRQFFLAFRLDNPIRWFTLLQNLIKTQGHWMRSLVRESNIYKTLIKVFTPLTTAYSSFLKTMLRGGVVLSKSGNNIVAMFGRVLVTMISTRKRAEAYANVLEFLGSRFGGLVTKVRGFGQTLQMLMTYIRQLGLGTTIQIGIFERWPRVFGRIQELTQGLMTVLDRVTQTVVRLSTTLVTSFRRIGASIRGFSQLRFDAILTQLHELMANADVLNQRWRVIGYQWAAGLVQGFQVVGKWIGSAIMDVPNSIANYRKLLDTQLFMIPQVVYEKYLKVFEFLFRDKGPKDSQKLIDNFLKFLRSRYVKAIGNVLIAPYKFSLNFAKMFMNYMKAPVKAVQTFEKVGEMYAKPITHITSRFSSWAGAIKDVLAYFNPLKVILKDITAVFRPLSSLPDTTTILAKKLGAFGLVGLNLIGMIQKWKYVLQDFVQAYKYFTGTVETPPDMSKAIGFIISGLVRLKTYTLKMGLEMVEQMLGLVQQAIMVFVGPEVDAAIRSGFGKVRSWLRVIMIEYEEFLNAIPNLVSAIFGTIQGVLTGQITEFVSGWQKVIGTITYIFKTIAEVIIGTFKAVLNPITSIVKGIYALFQGETKKGLMLLGKALVQFVTSPLEIFKPMIKNLGEYLGRMTGMTRSAFSSIPAFLTFMVKGTLQAIVFMVHKSAGLLASIILGLATSVADIVWVIANPWTIIAAAIGLVADQLAKLTKDIPIIGKGFAAISKIAWAVVTPFSTLRDIIKEVYGWVSKLWNRPVAPTYEAKWQDVDQYGKYVRDAEDAVKGIDIATRQATESTADLGKEAYGSSTYPDIQRWAGKASDSISVLSTITDKVSVVTKGLGRIFSQVFSKLGSYLSPIIKGFMYLIDKISLLTKGLLYFGEVAFGHSVLPETAMHVAAVKNEFDEAGKSIYVLTEKLENVETGFGKLQNMLFGKSEDTRDELTFMKLEDETRGVQERIDYLRQAFTEGSRVEQDMLHWVQFGANAVSEFGVEAEMIRKYAESGGGLSADQITKADIEILQQALNSVFDTQSDQVNRESGTSVMGDLAEAAKATRVSRIGEIGVIAKSASQVLGEKIRTMKLTSLETDINKAYSAYTAPRMKRYHAAVMDAMDSGQKAAFGKAVRESMEKGGDDIAGIVDEFADTLGVSRSKFDVLTKQEFMQTKFLPDQLLDRAKLLGREILTPAEEALRTFKLDPGMITSELDQAFKHQQSLLKLELGKGDISGSRELESLRKQYSALQEQAAMNARKLLGVADDASVEDITKAYRNLSRQVHPDVAGEAAADAFRRVNEAFESVKESATSRAIVPDIVPDTDVAKAADVARATDQAAGLTRAAEPGLIPYTPASGEQASRLITETVDNQVKALAEAAEEIGDAADPSSWKLEGGANVGDDIVDSVAKGSDEASTIITRMFEELKKSPKGLFDYIVEGFSRSGKASGGLLKGFDKFSGKHPIITFFYSIPKLLGKGVIGILKMGKSIVGYILTPFGKIAKSLDYILGISEFLRNKLGLVGDAAKDISLATFTEMLGRIGTKIGDILSPFTSWLKRINDLTTLTKGADGIISRMIQKFSVFMDAFGGLRGLGGTILQSLGPIGDFMDFFTRAGQSLLNVWTMIRGGSIDMQSHFQKLAEGASRLVLPLIQFRGIIVSLIARFLPRLGAAAGATAGTGGIAAIVLIIEGVALAIKGVFGWTEKWLLQWKGNPIADALRKVVGVIRNLAATITSVFTSIYKVLEDVFMAAFNGLGAWFQEATYAFLQLFDGIKAIWGAIKTGDWSRVWDHFKEAGKAALKSTGLLIKVIFFDIWRALIDSLKERIASLIDWMKVNANPLNWFKTETEKMIELEERKRMRSIENQKQAQLQAVEEEAKKRREAAEEEKRLRMASAQTARERRDAERAFEERMAFITAQKDRLVESSKLKYEQMKGTAEEMAKINEFGVYSSDQKAEAPEKSGWAFWKKEALPVKPEAGWENVMAEGVAQGSPPPQQSEKGGLSPMTGPAAMDFSVPGLEALEAGNDEVKTPQQVRLEEWGVDLEKAQQQLAQQVQFTQNHAISTLVSSLNTVATTMKEGAVQLPKPQNLAELVSTQHGATATKRNEDVGQLRVELAKEHANAQAIQSDITQFIVKMHGATDNTVRSLIDYENSMVNVFGQLRQSGTTEAKEMMNVLQTLTTDTEAFDSLVYGITKAGTVSQEAMQVQLEAIAGKGLEHYQQEIVENFEKKGVSGVGERVAQQHAMRALITDAMQKDVTSILGLFTGQLKTLDDTFTQGELAMSVFGENYSDRLGQMLDKQVETTQKGTTGYSHAITMFVNEAKQQWGQLDGVQSAILQRNLNADTLLASTSELTAHFRDMWGEQYAYSENLIASITAMGQALDVKDVQGAVQTVMSSFYSAQGIDVAQKEFFNQLSSKEKEQFASLLKERGIVAMDVPIEDALYAGFSSDKVDEFFQTMLEQFKTYDVPESLLRNMFGDSPEVAVLLDGIIDKSSVLAQSTATLTERQKEYNDAIKEANDARKTEGKISTSGSGPEKTVELDEKGVARLSDAVMSATNLEELKKNLADVQNISKDGMAALIANFGTIANMTDSQLQSFAQGAGIQEFVGTIDDVRDKMKDLTEPKGFDNMANALQKSMENVAMAAAKTQEGANANPDRLMDSYQHAMQEGWQFDASSIQQFRRITANEFQLAQTEIPAAIEAFKDSASTEMDGIVDVILTGSQKTGAELESYIKGVGLTYPMHAESIGNAIKEYMNTISTDFEKTLTQYPTMLKIADRDMKQNAHDFQILTQMIGKEAIEGVDQFIEKWKSMSQQADAPMNELMNAIAQGLDVAPVIARLRENGENISTEMVTSLQEAYEKAVDQTIPLTEAAMERFAESTNTALKNKGKDGGRSYAQTLGDSFRSYDVNIQTAFRSIQQAINTETGKLDIDDAKALMSQLTAKNIINPEQAKFVINQTLQATQSGITKLKDGLLGASADFAQQSGDIIRNTFGNALVDTNGSVQRMIQSMSQGVSQFGAHTTDMALHANAIYAQMTDTQKALFDGTKNLLQNNKGDVEVVAESIKSKFNGSLELAKQYVEGVSGSMKELTNATHEAANAAESMNGKFNDAEKTSYMQFKTMYMQAGYSEESAIEKAKATVEKIYKHKEKDMESQFLMHGGFVQKLATGGGVQMTPIIANERGQEALTYKGSTYPIHTTRVPGVSGQGRGGMTMAPVGGYVHTASETKRKFPQFADGGIIESLRAQIAAKDKRYAEIQASTEFSDKEKPSKLRSIALATEGLEKKLRDAVTAARGKANYTETIAKSREQLSEQGKALLKKEEAAQKAKDKEKRLEVEALKKSVQTHSGEKYSAYKLKKGEGFAEVNGKQITAEDAKRKAKDAIPKDAITNDNVKSSTYKTLNEQFGTRELRTIQNGGYASWTDSSGKPVLLKVPSPGKKQYATGRNNDGSLQWTPPQLIADPERNDFLSKDTKPFEGSVKEVMSNKDGYTDPYQYRNTILPAGFVPEDVKALLPPNWSSEEMLSVVDFAKRHSVTDSMWKQNPNKLAEIMQMEFGEKGLGYDAATNLAYKMSSKYLAKGGVIPHFEGGGEVGAGELAEALYFKKSDVIKSFMNFAEGGEVEEKELDEFEQHQAANKARAEQVKADQAAAVEANKQAGKGPSLEEQMKAVQNAKGNIYNQVAQAMIGVKVPIKQAEGFGDPVQAYGAIKKLKESVKGAPKLSDNPMKGSGGSVAGVVDKSITNIEKAARKNFGGDWEKYAKMKESEGEKAAKEAVASKKAEISSYVRGGGSKEGSGSGQSLGKSSGSRSGFGGQQSQQVSPNTKTGSQGSNTQGQGMSTGQKGINEGRTGGINSANSKKIEARLGEIYVPMPDNPFKQFVGGRFKPSPLSGKDSIMQSTRIAEESGYKQPKGLGGGASKGLGGSQAFSSQSKGLGGSGKTDEGKAAFGLSSKSSGGSSSTGARNVNRIGDIERTKIQPRQMPKQEATGMSLNRNVDLTGEEMVERYKKTYEIFKSPLKKGEKPTVVRGLKYIYGKMRSAFGTKEAYYWAKKAQGQDTRVGKPKEDLTGVLMKNGRRAIDDTREKHRQLVGGSMATGGYVPALVGEKGPELLYRPGASMLHGLGLHGPEIQKLQHGDLVIPNSYYNGATIEMAKQLYDSFSGIDKYENGGIVGSAIRRYENGGSVKGGDTTNIDVGGIQVTNEGGKLDEEALARKISEQIDAKSKAASRRRRGA